MRAAALLHHDTTRRIARHIVRHPGCAVPDIVAATGATRRAVYYHVQHLQAAGLLRTPKAGRYFELRAGPELETVLRDAPE